MSTESVLASARRAAGAGYEQITVEGVREHRPDIATAIAGSRDITAELAAARREGETAGRVAGAEAERARITGIEALARPGDEALVAEMKADGKTTPEQAAMKILAAEKAKGPARLDALRTADQHAKVPASQTANPVVAAADPATPALEGEAAWKAEFAKGGTGFEREADYVAFKRADARGGVKILTDRAARAAA